MRMRTSRSRSRAKYRRVAEIMAPRTIFLLMPKDPDWLAHTAGLALPPDVSIIGDSESTYEALSSLIELKPDILFVSSTLNGVASLKLTETLRARLPECCIVVVAEHSDQDECRAYLDRGVAAYLWRDAIDAQTFRHCLELTPGADAALVSRQAVALAATEPPLTVLVAEQGDVVRQGLRALLGNDPRFAVTETKVNFAAAAERLQPDLIVLDPSVDDSFDADLIAALHRVSSRSRLVIFTGAFEPHAFLRVMQERVHAYSCEKPHGSAEPFKAALHLVGRYGWVSG
ncbi:MAG: hypothetical protein ACR2PL_07500 [Dehalococcoidia bacterium]